MKALFLLHEQRSDYRDEPAYTEVVQPLLASGCVTQSLDYVYQREIRKRFNGYYHQRIQKLAKLTAGKKVVLYGAGELTRKLYAFFDKQFEIAALSDGNQNLWDTHFNGVVIIPPSEIRAYSNVVIISAYASQDEIASFLKRRFGNSLSIYSIIDPDDLHTLIYAPVEENILRAVNIFHPHLIVHTLTYAGENLRGQFLNRLKQTFPEVKIYTQWWDYAENIPALLSFERDCLKFSDMVGIIDSHTRYRRIKNRCDIYRDYPCVEKLHWHPTVFDPLVYKRADLPKKYDIVILGSAEGGRKDYIRFLSQTYGPRFYHFGGRCCGDTFISKEEYVRLLNETRIFVNTQTNPARIQLKGKVREALACGAFILEEDNPETRVFVGDMGGLVFFSDTRELSQKIDYYLDHPSERKEIARKGHAWYHANFCARQWSAYILDTLGFATH